MILNHTVLPQARIRDYQFVSLRHDEQARHLVRAAPHDRRPARQHGRQDLERSAGRRPGGPAPRASQRGHWSTALAGIRHRRGAVGQTGSIAVCERFVLTLKQGCTRVLTVVPLVPGSFRRELDWFVTWYNQDRPHMTLLGKTPDEIYFHHRPASRAPRFEPRVAWPRRSARAAPQTLIKGQPGVRLQISIRFVGGRRHLPQVTLCRAA